MGVFTKEQEEFMLNNYLKMSNKKLTEYFNDKNITIGKVQYWLSKNNLKREVSYKNNPIFSNSDISFIKQNYDKMTYSEIADQLGFKEKQVRSKAENLGLTKTRKINDHYFDIIDNSNKAYFLGFIFADGWIINNPQKRNYEFGMELQSSDDYILYKLNNELGGLNYITKKDECYKMILGKKCHSQKMSKLRIYSKNIVKGLLSNGIETNKTQKDVCPTVNDMFFADFIRGYIDGDGCYWKYKNHYYMHITCASEKVLLYIQKRLLMFNINTKLYKENDKKYRLMCINIDDMKKLISFIYYDSNILYLTRKYEKVKYYLGFAA